jgi:hypothetical protein
MTRSKVLTMVAEGPKIRSEAGRGRVGSADTQP